MNETVMILFELLLIFFLMVVAVVVVIDSWEFECWVDFWVSCAIIVGLCYWAYPLILELTYA